MSWSALRRFVWLYLFVGIVLVTGIAASVYRKSRQPMPPLEIALWYWHQPFRLTAQETTTLHNIGVQRLFVHAATVTLVGENQTVKAVLSQTWQRIPADAPEICLVFRVDDTVTRRLDVLPAQTVTQAITAAIEAQRTQATQAGGKVIGVQIDLDCPTRLLPRYATLLQSLRPALRAAEGQPALTLSITALSSWYSSKQIGTLLNAVDFAVPQFYEETTARTRNEFRPLLNEASLFRGLRSAERAGHPFYAGLPAYGHALVYDGEGKLRGAFHDAGAPDVLRNPDFRLVRRFAADKNGNPTQDTSTAIGEDILEFTGAHPDTDDYRLIFDLPTPQLVQRTLRSVRAKRSANCRGIILFRYPEAGEVATLPLPTLAAALQEETPTAPPLQLRFRTRRHAPWSLIESAGTADTTGSSEPTTDLFIDVTTTGPFGTRVAPDAATVTLRFDQPGILSTASRGGFDSILPVAGNARASLARATGVVLSVGYLAPGQTVTAGPIRITEKGAGTIHADWQTMAPGNTPSAQGTVTTSLGKGNIVR